jgi:hypothetical protein
VVERQHDRNADPVGGARPSKITAWNAVDGVIVVNLLVAVTGWPAESLPVAVTV